MNTRILGKITGGIFTVVAAVHFVRFVFQWQFSFAGREIPLWGSLLAALLAGYLAYESLRQRRSIYVCRGTCGGVSSKPGVCETPDCPKKGMPLEEVGI